MRVARHKSWLYLVSYLAKLLQQIAVTFARLFYNYIYHKFKSHKPHKRNGTSYDFRHIKLKYYSIMIYIYNLKVTSSSFPFFPHLINTSTVKVKSPWQSAVLSLATKGNT